LFSLAHIHSGKDRVQTTRAATPPPAASTFDASSLDSSQKSFLLEIALRHTALFISQRCQAQGSPRGQLPQRFQFLRFRPLRPPHTSAPSRFSLETAISTGFSRQNEKSEALMRFALPCLSRLQSSEHAEV
jgi:hypothetical protein